MISKTILIEQLDNKILKFNDLYSELPPGNGWVRAIRTALGMSLRQLGNKLKISPQSASELEKREAKGSVSLNSLKQYAKAMDLKFIYGFIPKEKSLDQMIEKRAAELATEIVMRTSINMCLEDQKNSDKRLQNAIKEKTEALKREMPKYLWD